MEKAYDLKELGKKLKGRGLDVGEELLAMAVEDILDWASDAAIKSENKFDDLMVAVIPVLKKYILEQVDKIDKEDDPGR